ncbi:MAG: hypothetical protein N2050_10015 [Flavobacteriales bacterium]|nr:hypothetical protein [Flavobacteriales bacterium]
MPEEQKFSDRIQTKHFPGFEWIDVTGPSPEQLQELAQTYGLDVFQVKDSLLPGHLPKFETGPVYTFLIFRAYTGSDSMPDGGINDLSNKMAFFFNSSRLITIHRTPFSFLDNLSGEYASAALLMLAIIRRLLQTYQAPLIALQTEVDKAEEALFLRNGGRLSLEHLYYQKARVRVLKKLLQLNQNVLADLQLHPEEASALQDARDRALALLVICEELLDDQNSLMNTYLSLSASRTNEVMKLLTIFSAFFLPLTFIAGIYGMNFDIMPELRWPWGYYFALGLMLLVAGVVYVWFKKKKIL